MSWLALNLEMPYMSIFVIGKHWACFCCLRQLLHSHSCRPSVAMAHFLPAADRTNKGLAMQAFTDYFIHTHSLQQITVIDGIGFICSPLMHLQLPR